jgi:endonuclease/exonuclease/phosphatase family metal-dependent hydrolase
MRKITICSLNCFDSPLSSNTNTRFELITEGLTKISPDIILLQEVVFARHRKILVEGLKKTGYNFYPENHTNFTTGGLMIITKNFTIDNFKFVKFKNQGPFSALSLTDRILGKGFQIANILLNNKNYLLVNTHLLCKYKETSNDRQAFQKQINELTDYLKALKKESIIIGGDINALPDSNEILALKKILSLKDPANEAVFTVFPENTNRGRLMNMFGNGKPFRTDYILLSPSIIVGRFEIIFNKTVISGAKKINLSDHYGLLVEIQI